MSIDCTPVYPMSRFDMVATKTMYAVFRVAILFLEPALRESAAKLSLARSMYSYCSRRLKIIACFSTKLLQIVAFCKLRETSKSQSTISARRSSSPEDTDQFRHPPDLPLDILSSCVHTFTFAAWTGTTESIGLGENYTHVYFLGLAAYKCAKASKGQLFAWFGHS